MGGALGYGHIGYRQDVSWRAGPVLLGYGVEPVWVVGLHGMGMVMEDIGQDISWRAGPVRWTMGHGLWDISRRAGLCFTGG